MRILMGRLSWNLAAGALLVAASLTLAVGCSNEEGEKPDQPVSQADPKPDPVDPAITPKGDPQAADPASVNTPPTNDDPLADLNTGDPPPPQDIPKDPPATDPPATPPGAGDEQAVLEPPFPYREPPASLPDFPENATWFNTSGPLRLEDLRGKFVILDFWTYCCINCIHILPELKKLEKEYPNELVVIGVHSAKFDGEKMDDNIRGAVLRYEIEHPVVNDENHIVWQGFAVDGWPAIRLIDPEGYLVGVHGGEFKSGDISRVLKAAIPYYRQQKTLDTTPIHFDLLASRQPATPLRFPGKVLADEAGDRLFISDSNHNRLVITSLAGELKEVIGNGQIGREDGDYDKASFNKPQGVALHGDVLYVADTENHLLRKIDLVTKHVSTISGTGEQSTGLWPGMEGLTRLDPLPERYVGKPATTALNSPWALLVHDGFLYIAMAGPHQIWRMDLKETEIGPYAGNGAEDIVDGPLLPPVPREPGYSSFAQPSGLTTDGAWLYVADSEGSSIRAVPFDPKESVKTIIGTSHLNRGRLFVFGDQDGQGEEVLLQHALGVSYHDGKIYVADTYNNKIKAIDLATKNVKTIAGTDKSGKSDSPAEFDEPAGLSYAAGKVFVADTNNHLIRVVDLAAENAVSTLTIAGLSAPEPPAVAPQKFAGAEQVKLPTTEIKPTDGAIKLRVQLNLPEGWKVNPLAPMGFRADAEGKGGPVNRETLGQFVRVTPPTDAFDITLPVTGPGEETLTISMNYYYCQSGAEGLCKVGSVVWTVPVQIKADATADQIALPLEVKVLE